MILSSKRSSKSEKKTNLVTKLALNLKPNKSKFYTLT